MWNWVKKVFRDQQEITIWRNAQRNKIIEAAADRASEETFVRAVLVEDQRIAKIKDRADGCKLEIYKDKAGEFRWRLKSKNRRIIAEGGEGYKRFENLDKSLGLVMDIIGEVEVVRL